MCCRDVQDGQENREIRGRKKEIINWCRLKTFYFIFSVQFLEFLTDMCGAMKPADRQLWTVQWTHKEYWFIQAFTNLGNKILQSPEFRMVKVFFNLFCNVLITNWLFFNKRHQDFSFQQPFLLKRCECSRSDLPLLWAGLRSFLCPGLSSAVYLVTWSPWRMILGGGWGGVGCKSGTLTWLFVFFLLCNSSYYVTLLSFSWGEVVFYI